MALRAREGIGLSANLPRPPGSQLGGPGHRLCHRGRAQRARIFVLKSYAAPSSGADPVRSIPAGAARGSGDLDGLEQATQSKAASSRPQPFPASTPQPELGCPARRGAGREAAVLNSWGAAAPGAPGAAVANRRRPTRPLPAGRRPRDRGGREQRGGEPSSPLVFQLPRRKGQNGSRSRAESPTPNPTAAPTHPPPRPSVHPADPASAPPETPSF